MTKSLIHSMLALVLTVLIFPGCKKDKAKMPPTLTTAVVTNALATTATGGGTITSDGGETVMNAGVCWSSSQNSPTITDDTTKLNVSGGSFTTELKNLQPNTTYYVRAYAINSVGVGYGETETFMTGNSAPTIINIIVSGSAEVGSKLSVAYTYADVENDSEGQTSFKWYVANDAAGSGEAAINNATDSTYVIEAGDVGKYIRVGVTPQATSGTTAGLEVKSAFVGAVGEPTTVTFMYNGQQVTYGIMTSPVTQRKWLDRNLGAPNVASAYNDFANYGDLFQWGRLPDGHQLTIRGATSAETQAVNGTTSTLATNDNPNHSLFILGDDWRNPPNNNLWQGVSGTNNPCPTGWRLPTIEEWTDENIDLLTDAYTQLKITAGGQRDYIDGTILNTTSTGAYWSSTISTGTAGSNSFWFSTVEGGGGVLSDPRAVGNACRCIKD